MFYFFMFPGKMIDYVKCLECGTEKSKEDVFLDIPLPVRPFGSTIAYKDIVRFVQSSCTFRHINLYL